MYPVCIHYSLCIALYDCSEHYNLYSLCIALYDCSEHYNLYIALMISYLAKI